MSLVALKDLQILPPKRPRENMSFSKDGVSRCGEIFVTNNADKWTFFCSYCQEATNDIGVFICHIRLDHLNNIQDVQQQEENIQISKLNHDSFTSEKRATTDNSVGHLFIKQNEPQMESNFIKEESIDSYEVSEFGFGSEKTLNKDISQASNAENMEIIQNDSKPSRDSFEIANENFSYCLSNENDNDEVLNIGNMDLKLTDDLNIEIKNSGNANNAVVVGDDTLQLECNYFQKVFKPKQGEQHHVTKDYDNWNKGFQNGSDLYSPQKPHVFRKQFKCPVCSFSEFRENCYIAHVMTHQHDNYFPCHVCAKVFSNSVEREEHYKIHIKERPHVCNFCCQRFYQKTTLMKHLKTHDQYKCYLCPNSFYTNQILEKPYICQSCAKNPNLKSMIEHCKSLASK